jgi:hypothetical protein
MKHGKGKEALAASTASDKRRNLRLTKRCFSSLEQKIEAIHSLSTVH